MAKLSPYISLAVMLCQLCATAQTYNDNAPLNTRIYNYKLVIEAPLYQCNILGACADSVELQVAEPGSVFTIVGVSDSGKVIVRFWKWKENSALNSALCYADSIGLTRKYFLLSEEDLANKTIPRYDIKPSFTAGTVLIPVKMRLQKFDFSKDLTLGPVAGINFRLSHYKPNFVSVLGGLGITSVTIDEKTTLGAVEEPMDIPALTPSVGFVFEFQNSTQAGIFAGWDFIADNDVMNFIYFGKPWVSFGLGFSILTKGCYDSETDEGSQ